MKTIAQRRLFMLFFIGLFIIIAPSIVLFAKGYRFDKNFKIFVHSGSITIKSSPSDIELYLDDKKQKKGNYNIINGAYTINNVRPGNYNLKCKKDGFTTWEKNIKVTSGISTEFWNVFLFPTENKDISLASNENEEIKQYFLSPRNKNELILFSKKDQQNKISFIDIEKKESYEIYSTDQYDFLDPDMEENVEWSSDNKKIIIPLKSKETAEKIYLLSSVKEDELTQTINLNELFTEKLKTEEENIENPEIEFEKVRWMFDRKDEFVVLTKDKKLYYFFADPLKENILLEENALAFDFAGNRIYYCQSPNKIIWEIKDNDIKTKRQITNQNINFNEKNGFMKMIAYDEYRIALLDEDKNLIVFNEEKELGEEILEKIQENVSDIQFSNDGKKLLYQTENEIWVLMLRKWETQPTREKNSKILITRFSQKISNVQWMDNYENIVFSIGNSIKSSEIDNRDKVNVVDLTNLNGEISKREVFYNKDNQILFFIENGKLFSFPLIEKTGILGRR